MHVRARCAGNGQQVKVTFQNYEQLVGGSKRFRNRSPAAEEYQSTHTYSFSLGSERVDAAAETLVRRGSFLLFRPFHYATQGRHSWTRTWNAPRVLFAAEKPIREKCNATATKLAHLDLRVVPAD